MLNTKTILLLSGIGAIAYFIYSKLNEDQKAKVLDIVKGQLRKSLDGMLPVNSRASFETKMTEGY